MAKPTKKQPFDATPQVMEAGDSGNSSTKPVAARDKRSELTTLAENESVGLQLLVHQRFKQMQLRFANEVPANLNQELTRRFWKFRPDEGVYTRQWGHEGEEVATTSARRTFDELCKRLRDKPSNRKSR